MTAHKAFMELILSNQQGELSPLEIGIHALDATEKYSRDGLSVKAYAEEIGLERTGIVHRIQAAQVYRSLEESVTRVTLSQGDYGRHLRAIHAAPASCWPLLVDALIKEGEKEAQVVHEVMVL